MGLVSHKQRRSKEEGSSSTADEERISHWQEDKGHGLQSLQEGHHWQVNRQGALQQAIDSKLNVSIVQLQAQEGELTPLVNDYLLSINNEYFVKLTYIPFEDLNQNV